MCQGKCVSWRSGASAGKTGEVWARMGRSECRIKAV